MPHNKFTSIESFTHVYRHQQRFNPPAVVTYGAKIKLHGTNAGVRIDPDGTVTAQGRNRDLSAGDDQFGFASWVAQTEEHWAAYGADLRDDFALDEPVTVHGEWAGRGVQRNDAVSMLDDKFFFVFAVEIGGEMVLEPEDIEELIPDLTRLLVLPWHFQCEEPLDFDDRSQCSTFSAWVAEQAEIIGEEDPFISEIFEVAGPGEGLVFVARDHLTRDMYGSLTFKAKAEHHRVQKTKKAASVVMEIPENVKAFVEMFVTTPRMEQAVSEACGGVIDPKLTGDFLKWMGQDVKKESEAELEEAGLEWKDVTKQVTSAALAWWKPQFAVIS